MIRVKEVLIGFIAGIAGACVYGHIASMIGVQAQERPAIQDRVATRTLEIVNAKGENVGTINASGIQFGSGANAFSLQVQGAPVLEVSGQNGNLTAVLSPN